MDVIVLCFVAVVVFVLLFIDRTFWLLTHPTYIIPFIIFVYFIFPDTIVNLLNSFGLLNARQVNARQVNTGQRSDFQIILARDLEIKKDQENKYETRVLQGDSRVNEALEAMQVKVLRIKAKIKLDKLLPNTTYSAHLIFKIKPNSIGLAISQEAIVYSYGDRRLKNVCLDPAEGLTPNYGDIVFPVDRPDGWKEVELGQFTPLRDDPGEVEVCLQHTDTDNDKITGLIVAAIEVRVYMP